MPKFVISFPALQVAGMGSRGKGLLSRPRTSITSSANNYGPGRRGGKRHATPNKIGAFQSIEQGRACGRERRLPLDREHRGPRPATASSYADAYFGRAVRSFSCRPNPAIKHPSELKGVPISVGLSVGQPLFPPFRGLEQYMGPGRHRACPSPTGSCSAGWKS